jgi:hypothetical protein
MMVHMCITRACKQVKDLKSYAKKYCAPTSATMWNSRIQNSSSGWNLENVDTFLSARKADLQKGFQHLVLVLVLVVVVVVVGTRVKKCF